MRAIARACSLQLPALLPAAWGPFSPAARRGMARAPRSGPREAYEALHPGETYSRARAEDFAAELRALADRVERGDRSGSGGKAGSRPMDFSKYRKRYVALEVLYLGHEYSGLARQESTAATIEGHLFSALERTRLIPATWTWEGLRYSRAGRTDRGVSALRQVLALDLRSAARAEEDPKPQAEEIDYPRVLNRTLPSDIRVTAWADAPEDFSARFSAAHREYTYVFLTRDAPASDRGGKSGREKARRGGGGNEVSRAANPRPDRGHAPGDESGAGAEPVEQEGAEDATASSRDSASPTSDLSGAWPAFYSTPASLERDALLPPRLDLDRMRDAASRFLGTHDFRNFCKVDVSAARHFVRTMLDVDLERLPGRAVDGTVAVALRIRGTAFLWHQIRCMAAVLRAVGLGLEEPAIVDELLDVRTNPRKPMYSPDDDRPLLLYECAYPPDALAWRRTLANASDVQRALREHMDDSLLRATLVAQMAKGLAGDPTVEDAAPAPQASEDEAMADAGGEEGRGAPNGSGEGAAPVPRPSAHPARPRGLPWIEDSASKRYKPLMERPKEPAIEDRAGAAEGICVEAAELARKRETGGNLTEARVADPGESEEQEP